MNPIFKNTFLFCLAIALLATSCKNRPSEKAGDPEIESFADMGQPEEDGDSDFGQADVDPEIERPENEGEVLSGRSSNRNSNRFNDSPMTAEDMDENQGRDEELGIKTLKGRLALDKGAQPRVDGVFISTDAFREDGKHWRERVTELKGKMIEVKGMVIRHWCGPMEQCLSQGYMDRMNEVEYLKIEE